MPTARRSGNGSYVQRSGVPGVARSRAKRRSGNGETTYIVLPTTSGCPSWPCGTPVENVLTTCNCFTFCGVICASEEKRVLAQSPAGVIHVPSACGPGFDVV